MQTPFTGTNLTRLLNEVRSWREFHVEPGRRRRTELKAVYGDETTGLAWVETRTGTWRLPRDFLPWALSVEEHTQTVTGLVEVFPCNAVFERLVDQSWEVEIYPAGFEGQ
ncbi:hypothetical protein [Streptomyces sp. NPDC088360]|uniref:hypothetical protein n=1 Tax=Streptomyces sp. NPDC088360 TaxID=3154515 RepID=UPI00344C63FE